MSVSLTPSDTCSCTSPQLYLLKTAPVTPSRLLMAEAASLISPFHRGLGTRGERVCYCVSEGHRRFSRGTVIVYALVFGSLNYSIHKDSTFYREYPKWRSTRGVLLEQRQWAQHANSCCPQCPSIRTLRYDRPARVS